MIPSLRELEIHRYDSECYEVAGSIENQWPHLKADAGYYIKPDGTVGDHGWNIAPDGTIIDMTATQHDYDGPYDGPEVEPESWPTPKHPEIIYPTSPEYTRYVSWSRHETQAQRIAHERGEHYAERAHYSACPICNPA